jgi:hypothetical protein
MMLSFTVTSLQVFDEAQHLLLCEELKHLYVALTRARKRCFLFDENPARRQPLFDYMHRAGVAEDGLEQQQGATATTASKSTQADWLQRAQKFVDQKLWAPAERCFMKGGDNGSALDAGGRRLYQEGKYALSALAFLRHAELPDAIVGSGRSYAQEAFRKSLATPGTSRELVQLFEKVGTVSYETGVLGRADLALASTLIQCLSDARQPDEDRVRARDQLIGVLSTALDSWAAAPCS